VTTTKMIPLITPRRRAPECVPSPPPAIPMRMSAKSGSAKRPSVLIVP
jgi:hypothetical protein